MRYKHIMWFFVISLIASLVIRSFQVLFTVDGATGFIKQNYNILSVMMLGLLIVSAIACVIVALSARRCPKKMPKVSVKLGIISIVMGLSLVYESFTALFVSNLPAMQFVAIEISSCAAGLFFVAYGLNAFFKFKIYKLIYAIPVVYWIVKLVIIFTSISSLALIYDNILLCASQCATLVFMLQFAKLGNGVDAQKTFKSLLASGLCASNLALVSSIPNCIAMITGNASVLHTSIVSIFTTFMTGLFVITFVITYFSNNNLSRHHRRRRSDSKRFMPRSGDEDNFYMGSSHRRSHNN